MTTNNIMFLQDMNMMTKRDMNERRGKDANANSTLKGRKCHTYAPQVPYLAGLNAMLAKDMLLVLLFLVGGARPCGTLCLQRIVSEASTVIS